MGGFRRFLRRLTESDETRLETEIREWADRVPGSVRIADAPMRQRVKIAPAEVCQNVFKLSAQPVRALGCKLGQVDRKERRVASQCAQPNRGIGIDVALPNLQETPTGREQSDAFFQERSGQ